MMEDTSSIAATWFYIIFCVLLFGLPMIRLLRTRCATVKTVKATLIDKHTIENFSKYSGTGKSVKYVVVFSVDGKKKSFYVSQFSYDGYRVGESGMLKYQGDKLIGLDV